MLIDQETGANSQPLPMSIAALTIGAMNHSAIPDRLRDIDNIAEFSRRSGISRRTLHSVMNPDRDIRKSKVETLDEIADAIDRLAPPSKADAEESKVRIKQEAEAIAEKRATAKLVERERARKLAEKAAAKVKPKAVKVKAAKPKAKPAKKSPKRARA